MSRPSITIGDRRVGADAPPFFLAEMSGNHNGSLARALEIVDAVAEAGAPEIKLQTYTADTITIDADTPNFRNRKATAPSCLPPWTWRPRH